MAVALRSQSAVYEAHGPKAGLQWLQARAHTCYPIVSQLRLNPEGVLPSIL